MQINIILSNIIIKLLPNFKTFILIDHIDTILYRKNMNFYSKLDLNYIDLFILL